MKKGNIKAINSSPLYLVYANTYFKIIFLLVMEIRVKYFHFESWSGKPNIHNAFLIRILKLL